jgi:hypothetical protein
MPSTKRKIMSDTKPVYEIRNGQGSAFLNPSKTEDWHPKYTGKCKIADVTYFFSVNPKVAASGKEYMEFKLGKEVQSAPAAKPTMSDVPDF